jgi:pilus assembly protein CpaD
VQHNIAAMVADPRDLLGPGGMGPVDTARRAAVMDHYEKGEITQADKRTNDKATEQSAGASTVGQ